MKHIPIGTRIVRTAQPVATWSGGTTNALVAYPAAALQVVGSGTVWLGTATVERDAPYSFFADRVRVHMPISGNGIRLCFQAPDEVVTLPTFADYRFDGARPVRAELINGPITAFNLIARPEVEATIEVVSFDRAIALNDIITRPLHTDSEHGMQLLQLVYMISGALALTCAEQPDEILSAGDAFVFQTTSATQTDSIMLHPLEADTRIIVADILHP